MNGESGQHPCSLYLSPRGAFSYLRRVVERSSGLEFAAKFIPNQAKPKASAWREARLLARLQHDSILYFHEAFERRRGLVIVTELYPTMGVWGAVDEIGVEWDWRESTAGEVLAMHSDHNPGLIPSTA